MWEHNSWKIRLWAEGWVFESFASLDVVAVRPGHFLQVMISLQPSTEKSVTHLDKGGCTVCLFLLPRRVILILLRIKTGAFKYQRAKVTCRICARQLFTICWLLSLSLSLTHSTRWLAIGDKFLKQEWALALRYMVAAAVTSSSKRLRSHMLA